MSTTQEPMTGVRASSTLPGNLVIARIRRVLIVSLVAALIYPAFMSASMATCAGGIDGDGGFVDSADRSADSAPTCLQLTLSPSPLVYAAIALIVLLSITRVIKVDAEADALRILDRAAIAIVVLVAVGIVVSQVWFRLVPIDEFTSESFTIFSPFPFGNIAASVIPMSTP